MNNDKWLEECENERKKMIRADLAQWGLWSRNDGTGKLTDTTSAMFVGSPSPSNDDIPLVITDEYAEQLNDIMIALKKQNPALYEVAEFYFIKSLASDEVARRFNSVRYSGENKDMRSRTVRRRVNDIVDFVYAELF